MSMKDFQPVGLADVPENKKYLTDFQPAGIAAGMPQPAKPEQADGVIDTLWQGAKNTGRAIGATVDTYLGDNQAVVEASKVNQEQQQLQDPRAQKFLSDYQAGIDKDLDGVTAVWDATKAAGSAIWDNPAGAGLALVEQLPNAIPGLAAGYIGAKGGAMAGGAAGTAVAPGPGTAIGAAVGGTVGFFAGMFAGSTAIETGHKAMEKASDGEFTDVERQEAIVEGAKKGAVLAAVDTATLRLGGAVSNGMQRTTLSAMDAATRKVLIDKGIDVTNQAAVAAARQSPEILTAVQAAQRNAIKATDKFAKRAAEAGTLLTMESVGEGVGEYLGEMAATGEADISDAVLEAAMGLGQSSIEAGYNMVTSRGNQGVWGEQPSRNDVGIASGLIQPTPTPDNPNPAPVNRPDPSNGPISAAAAQMAPVQTAVDLGVQFPEQQDWSQYDQPAVKRGVEAERGYDGLDGLIATTERMGFTDEAAQLITARRLFQQADQARTAGDEALAGQYAERGNRLYQSATETNDQIKSAADQFPVPYVATGEVTGSDLGPYQGGPERTGNTFDQPSRMSDPTPAGLEQRQDNRLTDQGIIYGEEPAGVRAAREQRAADDFSARYGQEGQARIRPEEGEYVPRGTITDEGRMLPNQYQRPAQLEDNRMDALPEGTGQMDMGRDRPERTFTPTSTEYEGVGRNVVERQAGLDVARLENRKTITQGEMIELTRQFREAVTTKPVNRTDEQKQLIKALPKLKQQVNAGDVQVTENPTPEAPITQGDQPLAQPQTGAVTEQQGDDILQMFTNPTLEQQAENDRLAEAMAAQQQQAQNEPAAQVTPEQQRDLDHLDRMIEQRRAAIERIQGKEYKGNATKVQMGDPDALAGDGPGARNMSISEINERKRKNVIRGYQQQIESLEKMKQAITEGRTNLKAEADRLRTLGSTNMARDLDPDMAGLQFKANGQPFASESAAKRSIPYKQNVEFAEVVPVDGGYAVQIDTQARDQAETRAAEQQQARSEQAKLQMYRPIDTAKDDLLDAIALSGGISRPEAEGNRIDPDNFKLRAAGIRWVFPANGGASFDEMAEHLAQFGYLDPRAERKTDLQDKVALAINQGRKIMTPEGYEALAEKMIEAEAQLQEEHTPLADDITSDEAWAGEAYAMAAEAGVPINVIDAILEQYSADPIATLVELNDAINEVENARAAQAGEGTQGRSADTEIPWNEPGNLSDAEINAIFGEPEQDAEPLLTSYTESDLQAQADAQSAAEQAEEDAQRRAEQKAQADAEVNDFSLTGSNRPADVAAAAGQNDMFGLGGTPRTEPASPTASLIHKDNAGRILDTLISEYEKARKRYLNRYAKNQYTKTPDPDLIKQATTKAHNLPNKGWSEVDVVLGSALMPVITNPRAANYQELITDAFYTTSGIERPQSTERQPVSTEQTGAYEYSNPLTVKDVDWVKTGTPTTGVTYLAKASPEGSALTYGEVIDQGKEYPTGRYRTSDDSTHNTLAAAKKHEMERINNRLREDGYLAPEQQAAQQAEPEAAGQPASTAAQQPQGVDASISHIRKLGAKKPYFEVSVWTLDESGRQDEMLVRRQRAESESDAQLIASNNGYSGPAQVFRSIWDGNRQLAYAVSGELISATQDADGRVVVDFGDQAGLRTQSYPSVTAADDALDGLVFDWPEHKDRVLGELDSNRVNTASMSWNQLKAEASERGVYRVGMTKEQVVEALNTVPSGPSNSEAVGQPAPQQAEPAPQPIESAVDAVDDLNQRINNGEAVAAAEVRRVFEYVAGNQETVKAELNRLKKDELKRLVNGHVWSDTKKAELVDRAYDSLIGDFRFIGNESGVVTSAGFGAENQLNQAREHVNALTDEQVAEYAKNRKAMIDERMAERKQRIEALRNPQTLQEYRESIRVLGMDKLTPEQRATYDRLVAEETMAQRQPQSERAGLQTDEQVELGEPTEGTHGKTGETIFNVKVITRLGKEQFKESAAFARSMGGGYYRGDFYFKSREDAELFSGWVNGDNVDLADRNQQRQEQKQANAADKLKAMADRIEQQASEALNADRKENTLKRMGEGERARAKANRELSIAAVLKAIPDSDTVVLKNATQKVQIELLDTLARSLVHYAPEEQLNKDSYSRRTFKDEVTPEQQVQHARMPLTAMSVNAIRELANNMLQVKGYVVAARGMLKGMQGRRPDEYVNFNNQKTINKVLEFVENHSDQYSPLRDAAANYKRLQRMGITSPPLLRTALLEYMALRDSVTESNTPNRLQTLERDLQRTIVGNRNAFNDFFPTPEAVAEEVVAQAEIEPGMRVLEPSAGNGMLADAAKAAGAEVDVVEMGGQLREILSEKGYTLVGDDFLEYQAGEQYDRIVMNPPFSKDQDIEHVSHAYDQLKPGGKLVAIVSSMAGDRANTRNRQFREWLDSLDAVEQPLPQGAFLSSMNQTGVNTKVLVIEKPMSEQDAQPATGVETVPEATLEDMRFLQKWGDHWQYALSPGRNWMTANSKEDAVKRATDRYWKTPEDERLTNDQRAQKADAEEAADMDFRYGRRSKEQIEQEIDRLNRRITEHQRVARREISGTDGRRTAPAVAAEGARTATEELMRLNRYYESKFGGNTVTAQGITIEVPTIDQQLVDDYNRATHMGRGRDLNAELRSEAEGLLNELSERQYTLDTPEQKTEAKRLIEAYLQAQAEFSQWDARYSANNPSWIVTGRSGRNMDKSNRANERHMDEYTKRVDRLQAQRDRIGDTLYKMRPQEVQENQALSADLRSITQQAGHILGYLEEGKKALVSETRKWASPKAHKLIERSLEADHGRTIEHIRELENTKAVQDAGGLVKVFGPRSKAGKLVNELLNEQTPQFSRRPQTETEAFRNWFGDSKVVDGNGDPLVVYHGTIGDFSEFSIKEYGTNFTGDYGVGFYFTQDPKTASGYADSADFIASHKSGESGGANVMPAYLKMENPLIVKKSFGTGDLWKKVPGAKTKQELTDGLISQGYDGVIVDGGRSGYRYISEAVVFSPNQIKSATGNNGNFDPNNPDIRFSPRNEVTSENTATEGNTNEGIDQLNEALQKAGETATARRAVLDTLTGGKRQAAEFAEALASAFGQTITWVQTDTALFDGVTVNGQLFVDVDSSVPYHIVMGHELTHILRNEHPDLYAQLESMILPDATARSESAEFHRFEEGSVKANEEYVADVVGNRFGERKFWADMAATEPGFFRRVAAIVRSLIQRVTDQFKSDRTLYGDAVKDLNRVRNQVAGVMMEYRRRQKAMSAQEFRQSQTGDLRFSLRDRIRRGGDAETGAFAVPEETWANVALRKMADKFQVLKDLQKNIQDAGGTVNESNDAYLAEELFHGKTEEDLRQMRETFIKPLADKMAKFGIEQKDLDQYLYAKHAPERNAHIAEINPELQEAGSGMSDAKAAEIIQQARESGKLEQYEQLAGMVYDMLETRRETIRSAGLEEGGMIDAWESKYEFYVPLKGWAVDEKQDSMARTGSGFNIAGKESKRALGRSSEAASPSSYAIQDLTETLIRRRKNEVGNTLLNLVQDNPNKGYWQVFTNESPDMDRQVFRSETEASKQARAAARKAGQPEPDRQYQETVRETPIPMAMMSDKYFQTKRNGQTYFIKLEDERLMKAMKNIGPDTSNFLIRKLGAVNRVLSSLNTSYNPEFVVGNFARDVQTAVLNLMAEQSRDDGKVLGEKIAKQTVKDIPKAMKAVYRGLRNKDEATGGEWQKWFSEFREAGAKTGWFDMKDIDGQADDLQSLISMAKGGVKGNAMKWFKATGQMVEDLNGAVENAVRLSAYVNARKAGISQAKAASLAKNMTVNFNRRGEVGTTLNALYMFANASIQGSMNFARTMIGLKGQKGDPIWQRLNTAQKVAAGLVMGSYAIAMANRAGAGEDDDGENWYDKVPDYVKERNLVIMKSLLGGEQDGSYWTIPLPYGYNIFHVLGNAMEGTTNGNTSIGKAATDLTLATLGSFSPIGFQESQTLSGTIARNLTPTLGKPIADIVANENFMGTSIYNENFPFGTPKPDSQLGRRSTPEGYKAIAEFLNEVSGGSQWRSGYIDINPDVMRYAVNYFTGAAGKFVLDKAPSNLYHLATLTPIESREALFYSRISGKVLPYADREKFYTRRDEVNQAEAEWKGLTGGDRVRFYRDNRQLLALRPLIQSTEKQLKSLRQQRDRIYAMNLPRKEQEERMERVEARMKRIIDRFNRQYKQATSDD